MDVYKFSFSHGQTKKIVIYEGHPIKNETFYSGVNLHARLRKSRPKVARLFGCSHVPNSTCYLVTAFVARQH